jgi:hypothetical protein
MDSGPEKRPTAEHEQLAKEICANVAARLRPADSASVAGVGDDLLDRAVYIVRNRLVSAGVPLWAVDMLIESVRKALEQLLRATEPGSSIQSNPTVES